MLGGQICHETKDAVCNCVSLDLIKAYTTADTAAWSFNNNLLQGVSQTMDTFYMATLNENMDNSLVTTDKCGI